MARVDSMDREEIMWDTVMLSTHWAPMLSTTTRSSNTRGRYSTEDRMFTTSKLIMNLGYRKLRIS